MPRHVIRTRVLAAALACSPSLTTMTARAGLGDAGETAEATIVVLLRVVCK